MQRTRRDNTWTCNSLAFKTFGHLKCKYEHFIDGLLINNESSALFPSSNLPGNVSWQPFSQRQYCLSKGPSLALLLQFCASCEIIVRDVPFSSSASDRKYSRIKIINKGSWRMSLIPWKVVWRASEANLERKRQKWTELGAWRKADNSIAEQFCGKLASSIRGLCLIMASYKTMETSNRRMVLYATLQKGGK